MKYDNSTTFINYTDRTSSSKATGLAFTSSKSDSLSSILKNRTFIQENPTYLTSLIKDNVQPDSTPQKKPNK